MMPDALSLLVLDNGAWLVGFILFAMTVAIQIFVLNRLAPRTLVGDENEYRQKAFAEPTSSPWVRVPLGAAPLWIARWISKTDPIRMSRLIVSVISATTVGLGAVFAYQQAGLLGGVIAGCLILASAERAILAIHLWSDIMLGLWLLLFSQILRGADTLSEMALLGLVAALGFLTRVDLTVLVIFGAVFAFTHAAAPLPALGLVIGPTLIAALAMTIINGKRHGIWAPDTTILFNIAVANIEIQNPKATTSELMRKTLMSLRDKSPSHRPSRAVTPGDWVRPVILAARRVVTLIGAETFVRHNLLDSDKASYACMPKGWPRRLIQLNLKLWFSVLFVALVLFSNGVAAEILALIASVLFTQSIVQSRSRYRISLLPVLAVSIAGAVGNTGIDHFTLTSVAFSMFAAVLLTLFRPRAEISNQET